ncbi:hypothetical protein [Heyndrickxia acidicola]|uniref:Uncharacterized protein n=1 Tax=Heyndrickxia acidicola TaxID=209389 RepID=A0ABU6MJI0_9BACI|nr:hypothetical protein [Heyndrickxia acidicola]MED1204665.1 hypothetical protein [Heyndrickxia acidicola]
MIEFEKGTIEEILVRLHDIGLQLNDNSNVKSVPMEKYKELLDLSIHVARKTIDFSNTIDEIIEDMENKTIV